jgi:hypothetical protein
MTTGQPQPTRVALGAGAPALADLSEPSLTDNNAGIGLPRRTTRVMFSVALKPNMSISAIRDVGTGRKPYTFDPTLPKLDGRDLEGRGLQWDYSIRTGDPHFRVGLAVEMMYWIVPWVGVDSCIADCEYGDPSAYLWGDDFVATLGVAVAPSYRISKNLTVFGNLSAKNHPTLVNAVTNIGHQPVDVDGGPFSFLVAGGMALELDRHLELALQIAQAVTNDPVGYGPSVSGWLRVGFGSSDEPPRRPRTIYIEPAQPPPT